MKTAVGKVKQSRENMWNSFKAFCRLRGYKYYDIPKELKYRYPAPGSVPHTQADKPHLYKLHYKTPFKESHYNIRDKPLLDTYESTFEVQGYPAELDMTNPYEANRADYVRFTPHQPEHTAQSENFTQEPWQREQNTVKFGDVERVSRQDWLMQSEDDQLAGLHETLDKNPEHMREARRDRFNYALYPNAMDDVYNPKFLACWERTVNYIENDARMKTTYHEIEYFIENVIGKERIDTKEMEMYRGQLKKWQVLDDDAFSREQIEKVQAAINAHSPDELEHH